MEINKRITNSGEKSVARYKFKELKLESKKSDVIKSQNIKLTKKQGIVSKIKHPKKNNAKDASGNFTNQIINKNSKEGIETVHKCKNRNINKITRKTNSVSEDTKRNLQGSNELNNEEVNKRIRDTNTRKRSGTVKQLNSTKADKCIVANPRPSSSGAAESKNIDYQKKAFVTCLKNAKSEKRDILNDKIALKNTNVTRSPLTDTTSTTSYPAFSKKYVGNANTISTSNSKPCTVEENQLNKSTLVQKVVLHSTGGKKKLVNPVLIKNENTRSNSTVISKKLIETNVVRKNQQEQTRFVCFDVNVPECNVSGEDRGGQSEVIFLNTLTSYTSINSEASDISNYSSTDGSTKSNQINSFKSDVKLKQPTKSSPIKTINDKKCVNKFNVPTFKPFVTTVRHHSSYESVRRKAKTTDHKSNINKIKRSSTNVSNKHNKKSTLPLTKSLASVTPKANASANDKGKKSITTLKTKDNKTPFVTTVRAKPTPKWTLFTGKKLNKNSSVREKVLTKASDKLLTNSNVGKTKFCMEINKPYLDYNIIETRAKEYPAPINAQQTCKLENAQKDSNIKKLYLNTKTYWKLKKLNANKNSQLVTKSDLRKNTYKNPFNKAIKDSPEEKRRRQKFFSRSVSKTDFSNILYPDPENSGENFTCLNVNSKLSSCSLTKICEPSKLNNQIKPPFVPCVKQSFCNRLYKVSKLSGNETLDPSKTKTKRKNSDRSFIERCIDSLLVQGRKSSKETTTDLASNYETSSSRTALENLAENDEQNVGKESLNLHVHSPSPNFTASLHSQSSGQCSLDNQPISQSWKKSTLKNLYINSTTFGNIDISDSNYIASNNEGNAVEENSFQYNKIETTNCGSLQQENNLTVSDATDVGLDSVEDTTGNSQEVKSIEINDLTQYTFRENFDAVNAHNINNNNRFDSVGIRSIDFQRWKDKYLPDAKSQNTSEPIIIKSPFCIEVSDEQIVSLDVLRKPTDDSSSADSIDFSKKTTEEIIKFHLNKKVQLEGGLYVDLATIRKTYKILMESEKKIHERIRMPIDTSYFNRSTKENKDELNSTKKFTNDTIYSCLRERVFYPAKLSEDVDIDFLSISDKSNNIRDLNFNYLEPNISQYDNYGDSLISRIDVTKHIYSIIKTLSSRPNLGEHITIFGIPETNNSAEPKRIEQKIIVYPQVAPFDYFNRECDYAGAYLTEVICRICAIKDILKERNKDLNIFDKYNKDILELCVKEVFRRIKNSHVAPKSRPKYEDPLMRYVYKKVRKSSIIEELDSNETASIRKPQSRDKIQNASNKSKAAYRMSAYSIQSDNIAESHVSLFSDFTNKINEYCKHFDEPYITVIENGLSATKILKNNYRLRKLRRQRQLQIIDVKYKKTLHLVLLLNFFKELFIKDVKFTCRNLPIRKSEVLRNLMEMTDAINFELKIIAELEWRLEPNPETSEQNQNEHKNTN